ncbi:MAG: hypothetical protein HAW59_02200 [Betaproteobacteria bacterium]|nr:hypothetical protein [Betaproteobacteria bacterium]
MSWEYALFLLAAAAALGAAFYFSMRAEPPPKKRRGKEPSFNRPPPPSPQKNDDNADNAGDNKPAPEQPKPVRPQGALPMGNFKPPELPPPPETLLPLDMCYAVRLYGRQETAAAEMAPLARELPPAKTKKAYLLGLDAAQQWRLFPEEPCRHWIAAVPLADRGGPINNEDIRRMEDGARAFAQKTGMHAVFPSAFEALENARTIDRFCAAVDVFIEMRLAGPPPPPERIGEVMRLVGMTVDGRAYVRRVNSEELFRGKIAPSGGGRQTVIFEMDAPNIGDPPRAFLEMMRAVRRAAGMLNMRVTDRQGADIDEDRAAAMCGQLSLLTEQMREFGAAPGSAVARLIFS